MKTLLQLFTLVTIIGLIACSDFSETYENVIQDKKIRPFAITMDPAEAAPGDTVHVRLHIHDAEKNYAINWQLALSYQVGNKGLTTEASHIIDLNSEGRHFNSSADGLGFSFVIPNDSNNPILLSPMVPSLVRKSGNISITEQGALATLGITDLSGGLPLQTLIQAIDSSQSIPNSLSPLIDNLTSLIQIKAMVTSPGFSVDVTKQMTVRYSNTLDSGNYISNVNKNPTIDSLGIIRVFELGVEDETLLSSVISDTIYFHRENTIPSTPSFDTLTITEGYSYFLIAASENNNQLYRSPDEFVHHEKHIYQWFYTNINETNENWEELITFNADESNKDHSVISINFPDISSNIDHCILRATVMDSRPEWGNKTSVGLDHAAFFIYLSYQ